jgi:hypothetical protein
MEEISRAALKHIEGRNILRIHIDKEQLMALGARFFVGKAPYGHLWGRFAADRVSAA